jgi:hypothetical protein
VAPQRAHGSARRGVHVWQSGASLLANAQGRRRPQTEQTACGSLKQFTQMSGWSSCARRAMRRTVAHTPQRRSGR